MALAKRYKPEWTIWSHKTVREKVIRHKRAERRAWKQYLKTGSVKDLNRASRKLTTWDFD